MEQNFTFLSGLSSKRAKAKAKSLAKSKNTSLVYELNHIALHECGLTWSDAQNSFSKLSAPLINKRDVESILIKNTGFTIEGKKRDPDTPFSDKEMQQWSEHLLRLNLICHYLELMNAEKSKDILMAAPMVNIFFNQIHLSLLPRIILESKNTSQYSYDFFDLAEKYENQNSDSLFGLVVVAAIHMGYQYHFGTGDYSQIIMINIDYQKFRQSAFYNLDELERKEFLVKYEQYSNNVDQLFKHTGVNHPYYPHCIGEIYKMMTNSKNQMVNVELTKTGLGVLVYGTETNLKMIYKALHSIMETRDNEFDDLIENNDPFEKNEYNNVIEFIYALSFDLRKAFSKQREIIKVTSDNEPMYGVKVLVPIMIGQIHCIKTLLQTRSIDIHLKEHLEQFLKVVLAAFEKRSHKVYNDICEWLDKTPTVDEDFEFDAFEIACADYLTRFKTSKTRLNNISTILDEVVINGSSPNLKTSVIKRSALILEGFFLKNPVW